MLLAIPEVQTELALTDDQKEKVKTEGDSVREKMRDAFSGIDFQALRDMTDEERTKATADMRKKMEDVGKNVEEKLKTVLDAKQQERLKQLELQVQGGNALLRPEVIDKLKITTDQQEQLKKIAEAGRPQRGQRGGFDPNASDEERKAAREKFQAGRDKTNKDMLAVLTDDQSLEWTEMLGKPFKFPPMQRGGFGRQGGGPGGPGGPGGGGTPPGQ